MTIFLETAELRAKNRVTTTMDFWRENVDRIVQSNDFALLQNKGKVSKEQMQQLALTQFERFDGYRKTYNVQLADHQDEDELSQLESDIKNRSGEKQG